MKGINMNQLGLCLGFLAIVICPGFSEGSFILPLFRGLPNHDRSYNYSLATTQFAVGMYKEIIKEPNNTNVFFSPISLYVALAMLNSGANHDSSKQIEAALGIKNLRKSTKSDELKIAIRYLIMLVSAEYDYFNVANKIWLQKYFCFSSCRKYAETIKNYFSSEIGEVNFARDPKAATNTINKWVRSKTNGRIEKLIPDGVVGGNTRFILTNAILFRSAWKYPFIKKYTRPSRFAVIQNGQTTMKYVQMMFIQENFYFTRGVGSTYKLLELPYKNERFSMIIIVPHQDTSLESFEKSLNALLLKNMADEVRRGPKSLTEVHLPKFKISKGLKANNALKALGIEDIFEPMKADLTGLTGFKGLYVSAITHKAYCDVDEIGTEASGGTGVITDDLILDSIRIDRPFLFFIHHRPTSTVVFLGRVVDPTQQ